MRIPDQAPSHGAGPSARPDPIMALACPHCGSGLQAAGQLPDTGPRSLVCARNHSFDFAKQGYVNLQAAASKHSADSASMVEARERVLDSGAYAPLTECIRASITRLAPRLVVDAGAGTGAYLSASLADLPKSSGLALELSRYALRRAARSDRQILAVGCDLWGKLPLRNSCVEAVISVFAPRNLAEFHRILAEDGELHVVVPRSRHLGDIRQSLGLLQVEPQKRDRLLAESTPYFDFVDSVVIEDRQTIDPGIAADIALMGPSAHHVDSEEITARARSLPSDVTLTLDFELLRLRRAGAKP